MITGASTGIGRATALQLDAKGWQVFAGVRREEDAESLREAGSERLAPLMLDVTDAAQIAVAAERIDERMGEAGLDGLVNNAGIAVLNPLETIPIEDFRRQIEVNLTAQVAVTQAMLAAIRRAGGRVVFVSSIGGRMALPFGGPYHAAKFGLEAVADCLRQELHPWGIDVAVVEPGSIDTPIWQRGVKIADEVAGRATAEQEALYGEALERLREAAKRTAQRGIAPQKVAEAIERALTARRPRTRYLVGLDARGQALISRLLPDRLVDRIAARAMGIDPPVRVVRLSRARRRRARLAPPRSLAAPSRSRSSSPPRRPRRAPLHPVGTGGGPRPGQHSEGHRQRPEDVVGTGGLRRPLRHLDGLLRPTVSEQRLGPQRGAPAAHLAAASHRLPVEALGILDRVQRRRMVAGGELDRQRLDSARVREKTSPSRSVSS